MKKAIVTGGVGALAMYLFDPELGRTRRAKLGQQLGGLARRTTSGAGRKAEYVRGQAEGLRHTVSTGSPPPSDEALTAKIESEVLGRHDYPKGSISINTVDRVVELRGTCDTRAQIDELEADVRKVSGVLEVHNYLHLPGTPPPNLQDVPGT